MLRKLEQVFLVQPRQFLPTLTGRQVGMLHHVRALPVSGTAARGIDFGYAHRDLAAHTDD